MGLLVEVHWGGSSMTHPPGLHKSHSDGRVVPAPFRIPPLDSHELAGQDLFLLWMARQTTLSASVSMIWRKEMSLAVDFMVL